MLIFLIFYFFQVRPADDNMMSMVTDMSHQCRIIESILTHYDWFFSDEDDLDENVVEVWIPTEKKFRLEEKTLVDYLFFCRILGPGRAFLKKNSGRVSDFFRGFSKL